MAYLSDQVTGGYLVLQHHDPRFTEGARRAVYAGRVIDQGEFLEPLLEDFTVGDVLGARHWEAPGRELNAWSYAMPSIIGVSTGTYSSGTGSLASGSLKQPLDAGNGAVPQPAGGQGAGGGAGNAGGGGALPVPGGGGMDSTIGLYPGSQGARWFLPPPAGNGGLNDTIGSYLGSQGAHWYLSPAGTTNVYFGPRKDFSHFYQPNPRVPSGPNRSDGANEEGQVGAWVGGDDGNRQRVAKALPVRGDYRADNRFLTVGHVLPSFWPGFPNGYFGIALAGTEEYEQKDVWLPTDPRMIAVNADGDPGMGSLVCDLAGGSIATGSLSKAPGMDGRVARLQSMMRVVRMPSSLGSYGKGPGNGIAWQLCLSEQDGLAGYGLVYGNTVEKAETQATGSPPASGIPGGGPGSSPAGLPTDKWTPTDVATFVKWQNAGFQAASDADRAGTYGDSSFVAAGSAQGSSPAVGLVAEEVGGFTSLGSGAKDKHKLASDKDGNPIVPAHIPTTALYHASKTKDAPLEFSGWPYPATKMFSEKAAVFLSYDGQAKHRTPDGKEHEGMWRWWTTVPYQEDPSTPVPTQPPPPSTPTRPPEKPPTTPGERDPEDPGNPGEPTTPGGGGPGFPGMPGLPGWGGVVPGQGRWVPTTWVYHRSEYGAAGGTGTFMARPVESSGGATDFDASISFLRNVSVPSLILKPQMMEEGRPDFRNSADVDDATTAAERASRPAVARLEAWGASSGGEWTYSERPGTSRVPGGTARGGLVFSPPQVDAMDRGASYAPTHATVTNPYFVFAPGTYLAFGVPSDTGDLEDCGFRLYKSGSELIIQGRESGSWSQLAKFAKGTHDTFHTDHLKLDVPEWDDVRVPVTSAKVPAAGAPTWAQFKTDGSGSTGVYAYTFDKATEESLYFTVQIPHGWVEGTPIYPHIHWCPTDTGVGTVRWGLEYTWSNVNGTFGNSTIISVGDAGDGTAYKHQIAGFSAIDGTGMDVSSMLVCRVFRDADGTLGTDDYDNEAALIEIDFHIQKDTIGSQDEFTKS